MTANVIRPVYLVKYNNWSSAILGADQIAEGLRARGYDAWSVTPRDIRGVRNAILVFIKMSRWWHLEGARRRGNITVLDVQDTLALEGKIKNRRLYDAIIWRNRRQKKDFGKADQRDRVIPQHWDPRYLPNRVQGERLAIGYFGVARSFPHWEQIPGIPCFNRDYFRHALDFNCHISVRNPGRDHLYKPNVKLATAAACEANLITTKDESAMEFLGGDYPYYVRSWELPAVLEGIEHARSTFGGSVWKQGLEMMRDVREQTSIGRTLDAYIDFFKEMG